MIQRSNIIIDPDKSDSFARFIQKNAKDSAFWERNRQEARRSIDKSKLDSLWLNDFCSGGEEHETN